MAVSEYVDTTDADQSFLGRSYLTYMVPFATNLELEEALQHPDGPGKAVEELQKREWLFFGTATTSSHQHVRRALVSQLAHS